MAPAKASALLCWIDPFVSPPIELQSPSPESMGLPPCLVSWLVLSSIPTVWAQRCRCACTLHKLLACPLRAAGSSQPKLNEADEGCPSELACQTSEAARPKFCPRCCQGHHVTTNGHDPPSHVTKDLAIYLAGAAYAYWAAALCSGSRHNTQDLWAHSVSPRGAWFLKNTVAAQPSASSRSRRAQNVRARAQARRRRAPAHARATSRAPWRQVQP